MTNEHFNKLKWSREFSGQSIHADDAHIWRMFLDLPTDDVKDFFKTLSADELEKAARFHLEKDQNKFIVARGALRKILGKYLNRNPDSFRFSYTLHGKPFLEDYDDFCFNLSHSGDFAVYAFTYNRKIGIDIELVQEGFAFEQIALRFFSEGEIESLNKISNEKRLELFFQYWTRKEAFIKAKGEGVSFPLEQCDVSRFNRGNLSPIQLFNCTAGNSNWHGLDLFPAPGYVGAIAVEVDHINLSYWDDSA